ncbi:MAG TPA: NusG domain II-containing protein [Clostridia bacterium]|jgi:hypothetical protein|nr:NusG domain II-containing protein [Clostridia bacterium]
MRYTLDKLKEQKFFCRGDILVYILIAVITVVVMCVFLIPERQNALERINIYYDNDLVYVFDMETRQGKTASGYENIIAEDYSGETIRVTIVTDKGENVVEIGSSYARMASADCRFADCVRSFPPIKEGGDIIVCLPNKITVTGEGVAVSNEIRL